jgi:WD40 repeat protein
VAASSLDRTMMVWDVRTGARINTLQLDDGWVRGLGFSPDGRSLYTAGRDRTLRFWDLHGGQRFVAAASDTGLGGLGVSGDPFTSPTGATVAFVEPDFAGERGARLTFLDLRSGRRSDPVDTGHVQSPLQASAWHPRGRLFATTGGDGFIRVWDRESSSAVRQAHVSWSPINRLDYNPDGRRIVYGAQSGQVAMVHSDSLRPVGPSVRLAGPVCCVAALPGGRTAVALFSEKGSGLKFEAGGSRWAVVDLVAGKVLDQGPLGFEDAYSVDASPDGHQIAAGGRPGSLVIIDLTTGARVRPPTIGHDDGIIDIDYDDAGTQVVSAGADGTVGLWDARSGNLQGTARAPVRDFVSVQFLPGSRDVLITSVLSGMLRWRTGAGRAVEFACQVAGRDLTASEWRVHLGERPYEETCPGA